MFFIYIDHRMPEILFRWGRKRRSKLMSMKRKSAKTLTIAIMLSVQMETMWQQIPVWAGGVIHALRLRAKEKCSYTEANNLWRKEKIQCCGRWVTPHPFYSLPKLDSVQFNCSTDWQYSVTFQVHSFLSNLSLLFFGALWVKVEGRGANLVLSDFYAGERGITAEHSGSFCAKLSE